MGVPVAGEPKEVKEGPVSGDCVRGGGVAAVVIVDREGLLAIILSEPVRSGLDCGAEIGEVA